MRTYYEKEADKFAKKHGITLKCLGDPEYKKYFINDEYKRYVFKMQLKRNGKQYTFTYGQSFRGGCKEPTMYDILSSLEKYGYNNYINFLGDTGYEHSKETYKLYSRVMREYKNVMRLFGDIIDELREIE